MPSNFNEIVAGQVRAILAVRRLRQWELAVRLDWGQKYLSRRLRGEVPFSTEDIQQIAEELEIPIAELTTSPRVLTG